VIDPSGPRGWVGVQNARGRHVRRQRCAAPEETLRNVLVRVVQHGVRAVRGGEELWDQGHVAADDGLPKRRGVPLVETSDELRPRVEAAFPGNGQLGIGQLERARGARNVRADDQEAAEGGQIAVAGRADSARDSAQLFG
jgi:hypothetical protein